jgi:hypothetical protein
VRTRQCGLCGPVMPALRTRRHSVEWAFRHWEIIRSTMPRFDSGMIRIEEAALCYESKTYGSWQLAPADVRIIGEFTSQEGPFRDDYFVCFARDADRWWEASFYADGWDQVLRGLNQHLDAQMELRLAGSVDFASRIIWPTYLVDQPMFDFSNPSPEGLTQRAKEFLLPTKRQTLSTVALKELSSR